MTLSVSTLVVALIVVGLAALLAFAATRPDRFRVERTMTIKAPREEIFALIDDFHRWGSWSPWAHKDPTMKMTYGGAPSGTGAVFEWDGNRSVGKGRMEIAQASPPSAVTIKLDFAMPFEANNIAEFTLAATGGGTDVTWAMHGPSPFVAKVMGLFVSMDRMVGKDFEAGLANLKAVAEK